MTRLLAIILLALTSCLGATTSAMADGFKPISGSIAFLHGAPNPETATICVAPVPGLKFADVEGLFLVDSPDLAIDFGIGVADTCAFFEPVFGVHAHYSGTFQWQTTSGATLTGQFFGLDLTPLVVAPNGQALVFETLAYLQIQNEAGEFVGAVSASGVDDPFGILSQNPELAGVSAQFRGFLSDDID